MINEKKSSHTLSSEIEGNILVATIGYHNLGNHSIGPAILPMLQAIEWPVPVDAEEMNWGPIAIVQKFQSLSSPYKKVIFLAAIERPGRKIGDVNVFRWMGGLPDEEMIQACIGDAVTGVISIENLLIIGEYFKIWPAETFIVDVEPGPEMAGTEFTSEVKEAIPFIIHTIQQICMADTAESIKFKELYGYALTNV